MPIDVIIQKGRGEISMGAAEDAVHALSNPYRWDLVVFSARDFPPPPQALTDLSRKVATYHVSLSDDGQLSKQEAFAASVAANVVANYFTSGKRVLVTCMAGRNRAGLVVALALRALSGSSGAAAARHVKARRLRVEGEALTNPTFVNLLNKLAAARPDVRRHVALDRTG